MVSESVTGLPKSLSSDSGSIQYLGRGDFSMGREDGFRSQAADRKVGSTATITTIEYELGLARGFPEMLERVAPKSGVEYEHQRRWHDGNGRSHVKASLVGPSLSIPFVNGELVLGEWQQLVLVEFDIRSRSRKVVVQLMGE
jgi:secondary thiamine-phosphate synthase enzyme